MGFRLIGTLFAANLCFPRVLRFGLVLGIGILLVMVEVFNFPSTRICKIACFWSMG